MMTVLHRQRARWLSLLLSLLLSACATAPTHQARTAIPDMAHFAALSKIKQFHLKGRIGIQMPQRGYTGAFKWQHVALDTNTIHFYSPLGSQVAMLSQTPKQAKLTDQKGHEYTANSAAALIETHLGWQLPLQHLDHWLLAKPADLKNLKGLSFDEAGHLASSQQGLWHVRYSDYHEWQGIALPRKILLKNKDFSLKLIIKDWQVSH